MSSKNVENAPQKMGNTDATGETDMKQHALSFSIGFLLAMLALFSSCSFSKSNQKDTSGLYSIKQNGKYGFIDSAGRVVIPTQFDQTYEFREGLCAVCIGTACTSGQYDKSTYAQRKYGFIDTSGGFVINPQYDRADYFSDGLAAVWREDKKGYIDKSGKVVIPFSEDVPYGEFSEGFVPIPGGFFGGYMDKTGKRAFEGKATFGSVTGNFSEGLAFVEAKDRYAYGYIDTTGKLVIDYQYEPPTHNPASEFSEGMAVISYRGKNGYIDRTGKIVVNPTFNDASPFSEGLACVQDGGYKFGFIDKTGQFVIQPQFASAGTYKGSLGFSEGLAVVGVGSDDTKYGFIDKTGKFVINPQFDSAGDFIGGLASVRIGKGETAKDGYIDKTGKFVWGPAK